MIHRLLMMVALLAALAGCAAQPVEISAGRKPGERSLTVPLASAGESVAAFRQVAARVEPVAEQFCRRQRPMGPCKFSIQLVPDANLPPNAFQTLDKNGRPVIAFTRSLIAKAKNADELAFILGHETAHHILGHMERAQIDASAGAILAGVLASADGADVASVVKAQKMGALIGSRQFSKDYELEADAMGARIAYAAGYDPIVGAAYFQRIPDPGNRFLGTHPRNAQRIAVVKQTVAQIRAGS